MAGDADNVQRHQEANVGEQSGGQVNSAPSKSRWRGKAVWSPTRNSIISQGMLDVTLLTANAAQLNTVLTAEKRGHQLMFSHILLILISISIGIQVIVGLGHVFLNALSEEPEDSSEDGGRPKKSKSKRIRRIINHVILGLVVLNTVVNILISGFGLDDEAVRSSIKSSNGTHTE